MTALKNKGFTLIELLIVMAILGVLAVVVLVAINPAEQLRRARDTGRISGVQQLGRAMQAYYTVNAGLPVAANWDAVLTDTEELQVIPAAITSTGYTPCTAAIVNSTWCYAVNAASDHFVVSSALESQQKFSQCAAAATTAFAVYSSFDARGGVVQAAPLPGVGLTYCEL